MFVPVLYCLWTMKSPNQSERSLHILSEMIWFIDRPILLAPYFLIVQSEELLLLKPVIFTKTSWCTTLRGENAVHFLCTAKWRVRGYIAPPKMKVKGYMYPQMKKTCGHAAENTMVKEKKNKKKNNDPRNTTQKTKDWATGASLKKWGGRGGGMLTPVLQMDKQFLFH